VLTVAARGLAFDVQAAGPPDGVPVLLLHGFPQHAGMWDGMLPALHGAGLHTIAVNQRGYSPGARPVDVDAYRISECAADALAILDSLAGARPVHVVGHDWGSVVGWHVAAWYPERVRTFTAISVPHPAAMRDALVTEPDQRERSSYIELFRDVPRAGQVLSEDGARRLTLLFAGSGLSDAAVERYVAPMRDPEALAGALRWYAAMSLEPVLEAACRAPTTFIWGVDDPAIGSTAAKRCGEYVAADYAYVPLDGVGHWVPDLAPGPVAEAVLDRISRSEL
jgi:pimeloyl-ACP methyl ester carboxylesterase